MMQTSKWIRGMLAIMAALALTIGPSYAGKSDPKKKVKLKKYYKGKHASEALGGGINPTNVIIVDSDLMSVAVGEQPAAQQIGASAAHEVATGEGIVVAILDGGFNLENPVLAERLHALAFDTVDLDADPSDGGNGVDDDGDGVTDMAVGHGTFVAGMVAMAAPGATILPIRVVDDEGLGTIGELAAGLAYAIAMKVDVINLSLEAGDSLDPWIDELLKKAEKNGIVVVVSAGNDGLADLGALAWDPNTIAVGAVDANNEIASFSNFSAELGILSVCAPGVDLIGPTGWPFAEAMGCWSGTSFSAGIVSGAAALALEFYPGIDSASVRGLIEDTAASVGCIDLAALTGGG